MYYGMVDTSNNNKVINTFGWSGDRTIPLDYPNPQNYLILNIPEDFMLQITSRWRDEEFSIINPNAIMDTSKDISTYFTSTAREQVPTVDPQQEINSLKAQNAGMLLTLVQGGLM